MTQNGSTSNLHNVDAGTRPDAQRSGSKRLLTTPSDDYEPPRTNPKKPRNIAAIRGPINARRSKVHRAALVPALFSPKIAAPAGKVIVVPFTCHDAAPSEQFQLCRVLGALPKLRDEYCKKSLISHFSWLQTWFSQKGDKQSSALARVSKSCMEDTRMHSLLPVGIWCHYADLHPAEFLDARLLPRRLDANDIDELVTLLFADGVTNNALRWACLLWFGFYFAKGGQDSRASLVPQGASSGPDALLTTVAAYALVLITYVGRGLCVDEDEKASVLNTIVMLLDAIRWDAIRSTMKRHLHDKAIPKETYDIVIGGICGEVDDDTLSSGDRWLILDSGIARIPAGVRSAEITEANVMGDVQDFRRWVIDDCNIRCPGRISRQVAITLAQGPAQGPDSDKAVAGPASPTFPALDCSILEQFNLHERLRILSPPYQPTTAFELLHKRLHESADPELQIFKIAFEYPRAIHGYEQTISIGIWCYIAEKFLMQALLCLPARPDRDFLASALQAVANARGEHRETQKLQLLLWFGFTRPAAGRASALTSLEDSRDDLPGSTYAVGLLADYANRLLGFYLTCPVDRRDSVLERLVTVAGAIRQALIVTVANPSAAGEENAQYLSRLLWGETLTEASMRKNQQYWCFHQGRLAILRATDNSVTWEFIDDVGGFLRRDAERLGLAASWQDDFFDCIAMPLL